MNRVEETFKPFEALTGGTGKIFKTKVNGVETFVRSTGLFSRIGLLRTPRASSNDLKNLYEKVKSLRSEKDVDSQKVEETFAKHLNLFASDSSLKEAAQQIREEETKALESELTKIKESQKDGLDSESVSSVFRARAWLESLNEPSDLESKLRDLIDDIGLEIARQFTKASFKAENKFKDTPTPAKAKELLRDPLVGKVSKWAEPFTSSTLKKVIDLSTVKPIKSFKASEFIRALENKEDLNDFEVEVEGYVDLSGCTWLTSLPENLRVSGGLNLNRCTGLTSLPKNLSVGGNLYLLRCTRLTSLPENLSVGVGLYLNECTGLTSLPENLRVGGDLNLNGCTGLTSLPNWITRLGYCNNGSIREVDLQNTGLSDDIIKRLRGVNALGMRFYFSPTVANSDPLKEPQFKAPVWVYCGKKFSNIHDAWVQFSKNSPKKQHTAPNGNIYFQGRQFILRTETAYTSSLNNLISFLKSNEPLLGNNFTKISDNLRELQSARDVEKKRTLLGALKKLCALKLHPDKNSEVSIELMQQFNNLYDSVAKAQDSKN